MYQFYSQSVHLGCKKIDCNQNRPELGLLEENMPKHDILWLVVDNQLQVTAYFP